jgi:hypothetical protein
MDERLASEMKFIFELASGFGFFVGLYVGSTLVKWVARAGTQFPHYLFNVFCAFFAVLLFVLAHRRLKRLTAR